jgi:hypothetical protein
VGALHSLHGICGGNTAEARTLFERLGCRWHLTI